jgi:sorting nexin-8
MAVATVAMSSSSSSPRRHLPPNPNSILDRPALIRRLEELGWYGSVVKSIHVDTFYQALHRQHYPDLPTFVRNYYRHEQQRQLSTATTEEPLQQQQQQQQQQQRPLKNSISNKKNRNKYQLPKPFLQYLQTTREFVTMTSRVVQQETCADQSTTKLVIALHDDTFFIESLLMRYDRHQNSVRASLCVSSQCGCAMGCTVRRECVYIWLYWR